ncbi:MAG TPA: uroporphyrinogen decarboxylase [Methanoregulaceae archaeon]|nr:uroporphyrinogen decarboxylase [Methanoregulaceae archaeon]
MNSIRRITATLKGEPPDRVPVIAQVFGRAAGEGGTRLGEYLRDGKTLARCQIAALERYGYDAVFALMDTSVETEAAGSALSYSEDRYPVVDTYALPDARHLDRLRQPDPARDGRMPELLRAAGILREEVGDETLVVGCVLGPLTITTQLLGMEKALYLAVDEPGQFAAVLDFATGIATTFGRAQIDAGVHLPVVFDPSASPAVVPPPFFREIELPRLRELFSAFKTGGSAANWLHIPGPIAPILPLYSRAGVEIANFDYPVSAGSAMHALPETCLDGNIKSLSFVTASEESIAREAGALLDAFSSRGRFILSSGCEIPLEAEDGNIAAMVGAVRERG